MEIGIDLRAQGYFASPALENAVKAALATRPVAGAFLFGPPGAGKSFLAEAVAGALGAPLLAQQMFPGSREDDLLVRFLPDEEGNVRPFPGVLIEAAELVRTHKRVVLLLDEWDKAPPRADSFLLMFLQTGYIRSAGVNRVVPLDRLVVFITSNEERQIAEPMLRRLPRIDVEPPSPELIRAILEHWGYGGHPYLRHAVLLYEIAIRAGVEKPATVQELRQLLDAILVLGDQADWDSLVFQFVTKSREDHERVARMYREWSSERSSSSSPAQENEEEYERIDIEDVDRAAEGCQENVVCNDDWEPSMPRPFAYAFPAEEAGHGDVDELLERGGGFVPVSEASYDAAVMLDPRPCDDQNDLPIARILKAQGRSYLFLRRPFMLGPKLKIERLARLIGDVRGEKSEIAVVSPLRVDPHEAALLFRSLTDGNITRWASDGYVVKVYGSYCSVEAFFAHRTAEMIISGGGDNDTFYARIGQFMLACGRFPHKTPNIRHLVSLKWGIEVQVQGAKWEIHVPHSLFPEGLPRDVVNVPRDWCVDWNKKADVHLVRAYTPEARNILARLLWHARKKAHKAKEEGNAA